MTLALLVAGLVGGLLAAGQAPPADLSSARTLYASASYEEALALLDRLPQGTSVESVSELRALCLLALGQTQDAEKVIAELIVYNPMHRLSQGDVSPKLVSLFHEVRRERFPDVARSVYEKAKSSYDRKAWTDAATAFTALLTLIDDPDAVPHQAALSDLKQLAEGFLALSKAEIAAADRRASEALAAANAKKAADGAPLASAADSSPASEPIAVAPPPVAAPSTAPPARPTPTLDIYSADDADVTPPVEVKRTMPRWMPPTPAMAQAAHRGTLELVIDETGNVASARVTRPIAPSYDLALRDLARSWKYRPAMRGNQPVRYRQVLEIVLRPAE